jgi:hypothetical protein
MTTSLRQLVLLTTYRASSKYRVTLSREEADAFLHGYLGLWHPAVVRTAAGPPLLASHYEYESPSADHLFAVPETPSNYQPGDWEARQAEAGSRSFTARVNWEETAVALRESLGVTSEEFGKVEWQPFAGLGLGYLILEAFVDAQDHINPLDKAAFYEEVRRAALAETDEERQVALTQAAQLLQHAREVVYPSQLYQAISILLGGPVEEARLEPWLRGDLGITLIGAARWLKQWATEPTRLEVLRKKGEAGRLDIWSGPFEEQEDALLPTAAWMANMQRGSSAIEELVGNRPESYGRKRFGVTPTLPTVLKSLGMRRSLGFSFDGGTWPHAANGLTAWRGPDGQLVECCNRKPEPIDDPATAFHLGLILYEATTQDYVAWVHLGCTSPAVEVPLWYRCWTALHLLAPVFGHLGSLESAIREIPATEQYMPPGADDFQSDYLLDLTGQGHITTPQSCPVSRFQEAARRWRQWESAQTLHALRAAITPDSVTEEGTCFVQARDQLLDSWQEGGAEELVTSEAQRLAGRLLVQAPAKRPGYLVFNPCSFARRVAVGLPEASTLLPAPAWASQPGEAGIEAVIEVPPLGFAWVPQAVEKGAKVRVPKQPIVAGHSLRNEHVHVEVDPVSGGIKSIRDGHKLIARLGQQLVYGPGSTMRCREVTVTKQGLAVSEITTRGELVDSHDQVLAKFTQRVRVWAGRKPVELTVNLEPASEVLGYPWHAYYAVRWAWKDAQARLNKSIHGTLLPTSHTRPETPGFIELEMAAGRTAIFSRGLPFWQRHGQRMLDTLLIVEGETAREFHLAVSVDDELPHLTDQDLNTPGIVVATESGPPGAGASSWLFFLDAPSVRVEAITADDGGLMVQLVETFGYATEALLQCPRNPTAATLVDAWGNELRALTLREDGVNLHVGCYERQWVRVRFGGGEPGA